MKQFRVKNEDDKIFLLIKDGTEVKKVFVGKLEDDTLVCQRDSQKHLFRKFNSYGFSKIVIEEIPFSTIEIHLTDGSILITTKPYLLENGLLRDNDGDEQIHLPISEFGLGKTLIWEKAKRTFPKHYKNFRFLAELAVSSNNSTKHIQ